MTPWNVKRLFVEPNPLRVNTKLVSPLLLLAVMFLLLF